MDALIDRDSRTMTIAKRTISQPPFMTFVKGMGGCAFVALCFSGALAAILKVPFSSTAQFMATIAGAAIGGGIVWYTGIPSAER